MSGLIRYRGFRWLVFAALVGVAGCRERPQGQPPQTSSSGTAAATKTVQLVIDFGDGGQKRFPALAWREGMTVIDALEAAKGIPHGVKYETHGSGEATLVTQIDDVVNQAGAAGAKNWLFYVNDKLGKSSSAVASIQPGDVVLWKFEPYVE